MLAPALNQIANALDCEAEQRVARNDIAFVNMLLNRRRLFDITRVGSITGLDRIGVPIVQVVRPLALSNSVAQGKGITIFQAAASAFMEALETWAAERIPEVALERRSARSLPNGVRRLFAMYVIEEAGTDWDTVSLSWIQGWDLFSRTAMPVPAALVDTAYTLPSPHPAIFPRSTTGLAAGPTVSHAVIHAALEVLERDAVAAARHTSHFFDRHRVDLSTVPDGIASELLKRIKEAGLVVGAWRVPATHSLPIYWCHLMEKDERNELVPLPAEGFGCAFRHDDALVKALLEACQARLTAIAGAREDLTRHAYPSSYDRENLAEWRLFLRDSTSSICFPSPAARDVGLPELPTILEALAAAGACAALVVPLFSDEAAGIHVIRLVAPPLGRHVVS
jgi:ribosomal protein S12 methylthiotransferase accessory factor